MAEAAEPMTGAVGRASRGQWTDDEIRCQAAATPMRLMALRLTCFPTMGSKISVT